MSINYGDFQKQNSAREELLYQKYRDIADKCRFLIVQVSQRRYAIVERKTVYSFLPLKKQAQKLHAIPVYEMYINNLTYEQALESTITLNQEKGINPLIDITEIPDLPININLLNSHHIE